MTPATSDLFSLYYSMAKCISQSAKIVIGLLLLMVLVHGATSGLREGIGGPSAPSTGSTNSTSGNAIAGGMGGTGGQFAAAMGAAQSLIGQAETSGGAASMGGGSGGSGSGGSGSGSGSGGGSSGTARHPCMQSCSPQQLCVTDHVMKNTCCVSKLMTTTDAWLDNPGCPGTGKNAWSAKSLGAAGNAVNAPFLSYTPGKQRSVALAPVDLNELEAG